MKLIFLNIWGGREFEPLKAFIKEQSATADVFCLQEVFDSTVKTQFLGARSSIFKDLKKMLPDFEPYYAPAAKTIIEEGGKKAAIRFGLATFVRKTIAVESSGDFLIFQTEDNDDYSKNVSWIRFKANGRPITICNVHGKAFPGHKLDTDIRLAQSKKILDFATQEIHPPMGGKAKIIIGGDFNLLPETESIRMFANAGYKNLIAEHGIASTRSESNLTKYKPEERQRFADYIFVNGEVKVNGFSVPNVEISDHLPLILDWE